MPKEYLLMVALSTQPPSRSGNGGTSVPPPAKLMRKGALARISMMNSHGNPHSLQPSLRFRIQAFVFLRHAYIHEKTLRAKCVDSLRNDLGKHLLFQRASRELGRRKNAW